MRSGRQTFEALESFDGPWESFVDALTMEELERLRPELVASLQGIDAQLSDRNRRDLAGGDRIHPHEYHEWRHRAIKAKRIKTVQLQLVKQRLKDLNREVWNRPMVADGFQGPDAIIAGLREIVLGLAGRLPGVLGFEDRLVIEAAENHLAGVRMSRVNGSTGE